MSTRTSRSASAEKRGQKAGQSVQPNSHPLVTCRISVFWEGEQKFFKGHITREVRDSARSTNLFHVEYDDGEAHDEDLKHDRFKWHGPRGKSAPSPYHPGMRAAMLALQAENVHEGTEDGPGSIVQPKGGIPVHSEAVGWRVAFWWDGTREWVDGEVLSYRAIDARHLLVFADGELEWMSIAGETIRWVGNTRERGNRLAPISFGLEGNAAPPKGREAVEWVVDVYDKNTKQMQRVEIAEFDSVTGKHKLIYAESRKAAWASLTASKIVWRFPPGLPMPGSDQVVPGEQVEPPKADAAAPKNGTSKSTAPGPQNGKGKRARQIRKAEALATSTEVAAPEGSAVASPKGLKGRKQGSHGVHKAKAPIAAKAKVANGARVSVGCTEVKRDVKQEEPAAVETAQKRAAEATPVPETQAKRICLEAPATAAQPQPAAAEQPPASAEPAPAASPASPAIRKRRASAELPSAKPPQPAAPVDKCTSAEPVAKPAAVASAKPPATPVQAAEMSGPSSVSHIKPAPIPPLRQHKVARDAAFIRCSLMSADSMIRDASAFNGSVQALLAATERRQQFVQAVLKHFGESPVQKAPVTPSHTPDASKAGAAAAVALTLPTDPRRVSKTLTAGEAAARNLAPTPPNPAPAPAERQLSLQPPSLQGTVKPATPAPPPPAPTPALPANSENQVAARNDQAKSGVPLFTPKFAPLSSFQRGNSILGNSPGSLPASIPESATASALLKQRQGGTAVAPSLLLPTSMAPPQLPRTAPDRDAEDSAAPAAVGKESSDQTSSSCQIDDMKGASLAKHSNKVSHVQQQGGSALATSKASRPNSGNQQKPAALVHADSCTIENSKCNVSTVVPRAAVSHVQEANRGPLNLSVSSNLRATAQLRWSGAPLVAARQSIGLKGGSQGGGSAGGRACG